MLYARLKSMPEQMLSLDTETWRIDVDHPLPPIVCGSAAWFETGPKLNGKLLTKWQALEIFSQALENPDVIITGANIAYDLLCFAAAMAELGIDAMPAIFAALHAGRLFDILIAEPLNAVAHGHLLKDPRTGGGIRNPKTGKQGGYSLDTVTDMVLGRVDAKANDEWKLRYRELELLLKPDAPDPFQDWPQAARDYPVDDVRNTGECALAQAGHLPQVSAHHRYERATGATCVDCGSTQMSSMCLVRRPHLNLHEVANQTYSAFVLSAGAAWGLEVDQTAADVIERYALRRRKKLIQPFIDANFLDVEDQSENRNVIKRAIAIAYGSNDACPICAGTGKVPSRKVKTLQCKACRGRCQPWKSGGKIKDPTVEHCGTCLNTGKIPHPNPDMVNCIAWDAVGDEINTCDGSGLVLSTVVPRSKGGGIAYGRDALNESGADFLQRYGDFLLDAKVLKDYIPFLRTARTPIAGHAEGCPKFVVDEQKGGKKSACRCDGPYRSVTMTFRPNTVLDTGRVSYAGYVMLLPRKPGFIDPDTGEYIPSLRECFVARGPRYRYVEVPDDHVLQPGEERVAC